MVTNSWMEQHEKRASYTQASSATTFLELVTGGTFSSASDVVVTIDVALGVPAVWAAVNFLSGTIAGLPLKVYRRTRTGREQVTGALARMLHDAPNDEMSSFDWRKWFFDSLLTGGRGLTYIERNEAGAPINLFPLEAEKTVIKRLSNGRKIYEYKTDAQDSKTYQAADVIDMAYMLRSDGLRHRGPIATGKDAIGLAVAANQYGSKFLANGGVPPFAITGNFQTPQALRRASDDFRDMVSLSAKENRQALTLPAGLEIKSIGADPEKSQLVELQRFCIEQIARLYQLPPVFLQDLTHGTFSNTEQQDLHLVKHTLKRWVEQFEQQLNLKLFGRSNTTRYVEFNMDGLLRGDFKTRMEGYASATTGGFMSPSEVRDRENLPYVEGSDRLFMQGAMMPIDSLGQDAAAPPATGDEDAI